MDTTKTEDTIKPNQLYRLTRDVQNPHPDRRSLAWNKLPVWSAGTIVRAFGAREGLVIGRAGDPYPYITSVTAREFPTDALEHVTPSTIEQIMDRVGARDESAVNVLAWLVRNGSLGIADVAAAYAAYETDLEDFYGEDGPEDDEGKTHGHE